jgi:hypothetical protein
MVLSYIDKIEQEVRQIPAEYLPDLFSIVHGFRESIGIDVLNNEPKNTAKSANIKIRKHLVPQFNAVRINTSGFHFNREEANDR